MDASDASAGMPGVKKYKVLSPLSYGTSTNDQRLYKTGEHVWLTDRDAAPLLGSVVATIVVESAQDAIARRISGSSVRG